MNKVLKARIPILDIPGVQELVKEAWLAGCMKGKDWSSQAQEQRALDGYMKVLEDEND